MRALLVVAIGAGLFGVIATAPGDAHALTPGARAAAGDLSPFLHAAAGNEARPGDGAPLASLTANAWVSPYRGGTGGGYFTLGCPGGEIAVGFHGRSGWYVDQIGLVCAYVNPDGSLGPDDWQGTTGGTGGSFFFSRCPLGYAIGGLAGRSGSYIDQIQPVCRSLSGDAIYYGPSAGGSGGGAWVDIAPPRHFLTQLMGRSGSYIDAVQAIHHYVTP